MVQQYPAYPPQQPQQGQQPQGFAPYHNPAYPGMGTMGPQAPAPGIPMDAEIKWSNLDSGGVLKTPLKKFIGRFDSYKKEEHFNNLYVCYKFSNVQVLDTDAPWPYATADIYIKYSNRENSGWGKHVESVKGLGLAQTASTLDAAIADLQGKVFEVHKDIESYGTDKATGNNMQGEVFRFVRIIQPGVPQPQPQVQQTPVAPPSPPVQPVQTTPPQVAQVPTPVAPAMDPAVLAALQAAGAIPAMAPSPVPTTVQPTGFDLNVKPDDTPYNRALKLINGRNLNEFLGLALTDDRIKSDDEFVKSIYNSGFVNSAKHAGQIVEENGIYKVVV